MQIWKDLTVEKLDAKKIVKEKDLWLFEANCIHIASKYHPKSLNVLLSNLKNKAALINQAHEDGKISPLHVAPLRVDSLSTR